MAGLGYRLIEGSLRALGAREEKVVAYSRTYAAAKSSRLNGDWNEVNSSANQEIKMSSRTLRARARQLDRDDDYFKAYCDKAVTSVVGQKGIKLEPNAKDASGKKVKALNDPLKSAWSKWCRSEFASATGLESWRDILSLALRTCIVDGETIIRTIFDKKNPFKFSLHFIDADWLDEDYNETLPNGNRVIMSVEIDMYNKPVAYYFTPPRWNNIGLPDYPGNLGTQKMDRVRVPSREIIHLFVKSRPGQVRGVTWAHTAMTRLNMLNGYEEAELVGQRVAASVSAYAIPPAPTDVAGPNTPDDIEEEVQAGIIKSLPAGYDLKVFDPNRPGNTYSAFVKQILRAIAGGLGISYNALANDLESTSYSSIRAGSIEERDNWRVVQEWLAEHLCQPIYEKWLMWNIEGTELAIPAVSLDDVRYPVWRGRGFDWVDPSKDTKADVEAVNAGLKTRTEILAERGRDFDEVMEEFAHEQEVMDEKGLSFGVDHEALLQMEADAAASEQEEAAAKQQKAAA